MAFFMRVFVLAIAIATFGSLSLPGSASAAPPISFQVSLGSQCVFGTAPQGERLHLALWTASDHLRARASVRPKEGSYTICFDLVGSGINGTDQLRARSGDFKRRFTVPAITPLVDRVRDVVTGDAPPGAPLQMLVVNVVTLASTSVGITVAPNGHYSVDVSKTVDIKGGWLTEAVVLLGNDLVRADGFAPWTIISRGNETVRGYTAAKSSIHVEMRDAAGHLRSREETGPDPHGQFILRMLKPNGTPAYPHAGDVITTSIASDSRMVVPTASLRGDPVSDRVTGRCMPGVHYQLVVEGRIYTFTFLGTTRPDGTIDRNVGTKIDMRMRDRLQLVCFYPTGDTFLITGEAG